MRQHFINQALLPPSPAMTKAYLMGSARYLTGDFAGDHLYSDRQGMGALDLGFAFDGESRILRDQLAHFEPVGGYLEPDAGHEHFRRRLPAIRGLVLTVTSVRARISCRPKSGTTTSSGYRPRSSPVSRNDPSSAVSTHLVPSWVTSRTWTAGTGTPSSSTTRPEVSIVADGASSRSRSKPR